MLLYGDPQFEIRARDALERLREQARRAESGELDRARDLLIAAGQLEQGVADSPAGLAAGPAERVTDAAAEYFLSIYRGENRGELSALNRALESAVDPAADLLIKIPEGFAFYGLYPEQYCAAAFEWMGSRPRGSAWVVGLRSIGTTLSAVVRACLAHAGWNVRRLTLRPSGHPFERRVSLPREMRLKGDYRTAIVVDEGPGLSGSSMAAAARALREAGANDITFFPGHANPPGPAASESVCKIWMETPAVVPSAFPLAQAGSLGSVLREATGKIFGSAAVESTELGAGKWREFSAAVDAPAAPALERRKVLIRCENGRAMLWKFAGLGAGPALENLGRLAFARQEQLSAMRWCSPPLARHCGFIGTEWVNARCHTAAALNESRLEQLARYIQDSEKPRCSTAQAQNSIDRLKTLCEVNFRKADLPALARQASESFEKLDPAAIAQLPLAGDGRLAPHEWLDHGTRMLKTDVWGHDYDHTFPGPQPVFWDIAGAAIDWRMSPAQMRHFFSLCGGIFAAVPPAAVHAYILAHCAFRIGVDSLADSAKAFQPLSGPAVRAEPVSAWSLAETDLRALIRP